MKITDLIKKRIIELYKKAVSIKKRTKYCIVAGCVFSVLSFFLNDTSIYIRPYEIERSTYGTQKTPYNIILDAENLSKDIKFNVAVSAKKYDKDEADKIFVKKFEELLISMLGKNDNYDNVNTKLNFKSDLGDGIRATYSFNPSKIPTYYKNVKEKYIASPSSMQDDKNVIATNSNIEEFHYYVKYKEVVDGQGNIKNENFKDGEFCTGYIEVRLSTDIKGKDIPYKSNMFMVPIRVTNKPMTAIEVFKVAFEKKFAESDKSTIDSDTIVLPKFVNDFKIRYKERKDLKFLIMPLIGIIIAILLDARDKEKEREIKKQQTNYLEIDYGQIVTKILLYVNSGMTIRNAMIRIAELYQKNNEYKAGVRIAYDELVLVKNKLNSGYNELYAYEEMAKNINLRTYTRFLNIIIQSIKNGNKDLKNILNMEVQDALYERKQHAKKLGEEAATKLVLPLMMMLAIIMVVIMVPAFMGM